MPALPLLWRAPLARARALTGLRAALVSGDPAALTAAVEVIDGAVSAALRALALPRGVIARIEVADFGRGWAGRKLADCHLLFDRSVLARRLDAARYPDDTLRTWTHESLHARQSFTGEYARFAATTSGYEEGLAEALARLVLRAGNDMHIRDESYAYFTGAYRALAVAVGVEEEALLRNLWRAAPGDVRAVFVDTVDDSRRAAGSPPFTTAERGRLQAIGDTLFATNRAALASDVRMLIQTWRVVFR